MKRALLILLAVALLLPSGSRAQSGYLGQAWTCSLDNLADTITLCVSAAEPGMRRYITDIVAQSTTALGSGLFQLQYNTAVASGGAVDCGVDGLTLFPPGIDPSLAGRFAASVNTTKATAVSFSQPLIVPAGKDLCILGDPTNPVTVQLSGYIAP